MYKLLALDMDGTLLQSDHKTVSLRTHHAIMEAKRQGVHVSLVTGRPLSGVIDYVNLLELDSEEDLIVTYNGSLIINPKTQAIVAKNYVSPDSYQKLYELSLRLNVGIHALSTDIVHTPKDNQYTQLESDINQLKKVVSPIDGLGDSQEFVKVMYIDDEEVLDRVVNELPDWARDNYTIVRSSPYFLEFLNPLVDKGFGVSVLAEKYGLTPDEVICIGDAGNDLHMINYAGLGVAMGNATNELKKAADYVTASNDEDGIVQVIDRFILDKIAH